MPDFDSKVNAYLEPSEVRRLIDAVPHVSRCPARDALLLETMWQSGTRVSEAIVMLPERVGQSSILFTNLKQYKRVKQNGKMVRVSNPQAVKEVEVSEVLCTAIHEWVKEQKIKPGQWVFRGKFKGGHVSREYVWRLMDKLGKDTGILRFGKNNPRTGIRFKGPFPHSLRHCLSGGTRIITPIGVSLAKDNITEVISVDSELNQVPSRVTSSDIHESDLVRIRAGGNELECSPMHRLFTFGSNELVEIRAKDLKIGDFVAGVSKIELPELNDMGSTRARILGYFIGDGSLNIQNGGICFNDKRKYIPEFYAELLKGLGLKKLKGKGKFIIKVTKCSDRNSYVLKFNSMEFIRWLIGLNCGTDSKTWHVPNLLWTSTIENTTQFLAGFYDAEGYSNIYTSCNKELLLDVQLLLLRLGLRSFLEERNRDVKLPQGRTINQTQYTLYISDGNKFFSLVPTLKKQTLLSCAKNIVPLQHLVRLLVGRRLPSGRFGIHDLGRYLKLCAEFDTAKKILALATYAGISCDFWHKFMNSTIVPLRITSIKPLEAQVTYDYGIVKGNLITNGFVSHNSLGMALQKASGGDLSLVGQQLGHSSIASTAIYARTKKPEIKRVVREMDWGQRKEQP